MTAPPAAATTPRARTQQSTHQPRFAHGATAVEPTPGRRRGRASAAVRNVGIALDTVARVVFLGRDGVKL
ncbi:hypothetical protein CFP65_4388 [Kitasatospora sp. MMS16-BH015]|nr:hypothetical protein CFP65_4388 [Kitasatospora sp. MMS16-BH015]